MDSKPRDSRALALVLNERAGALLGSADAGAAWRAQLSGAGITLHEPDPGGLPERIRAAAAAGVDGIVVAGGDGSIACAAQLLAGTGQVLGILPAGTMNLLARDLRLPVGEPGAAADVLIAGQVRHIDVGQIGEHVFACACMLGTPARIGHHRERARKQGSFLLAWLPVAHAALRAARRDRALKLTLRIDGREIRVTTPALTITVNALDDATGRAFGRTVLDGGRLCAYVLHRRSPWDLLRLFWHLARGTVRDRALRRLDGREIDVHADVGALRILIDGEEHLLAPPLHFTIRPKALAVIAP